MYGGRWEKDLTLTESSPLPILSLWLQTTTQPLPYTGVNIKLPYSEHEIQTKGPSAFPSFGEGTPGEMEILTFLWVVSQLISERMAWYKKNNGLQTPSQYIQLTDIFSLWVLLALLTLFYSIQNLQIWEKLQFCTLWRENMATALWFTSQKGRKKANERNSISTSQELQKKVGIVPHSSRSNWV